jgi:hypothetical protein
MEVSGGLKILHCTSDILGVAENDGFLEITLCGDRDLAGEIVFEGPDAMKVRSATIDNEAVKVVHDGKRTACIYGHANRKEFILMIKFK